MNTIDVNIHLADQYFRMLDALSDNAKIYLAKKLTDSVGSNADEVLKTKKEKADEALRRLAGAWADDPESDMMADAILNGRVSNAKRHLVSFDDE